MLGSKVKAWYVSLLEPITRTSLSFGIHPNVLTILGFAITVFSGILFAMGAFLWAGVVLFIGGSCDVLDGHLARITDQKSVFGALLDSTLDRYAEIVVFIGIVTYYLYNAPADPLNEIWVIMAVTGLTGSLMVSYVRARAEGLGQECKVGLMQRPERVICLGVGALLGEMFLSVDLVLIAVVSNLTAVSRLYHIWKQAEDA